MPVDRNTWIAASPRDDRTVAIYSLNADSGIEFSLDDIKYGTAVRWTNYVKGVASILQLEGYSLSGFNGLIHSTVPFSSGLSSSAALEVATATLLKALGNLELAPVKLALLCKKAENEFVGVNCGILDQYTSSAGRAGHALLLDCRDLSSRGVAIHPAIRVVICDTQAKRELTGSKYAERRAQCEKGATRLSQFYPNVKALRDVTLAQFEAHEADLSEVVRRRCRFIIEENQRVLALAAALPPNDRARIGVLTTASFAGARDLYEISVPEMEAMIDAMRSGPGVIGARQAGAGFGGCMVAFVDQGSVDAFIAHVQKTYLATTGIHSKVYVVQAAAGAGTLKPIAEQSG
jgi:galactokinase